MEELFIGRGWEVTFNAAVLLFTLLVIWTNKNKNQEIRELDEKNRRLRIEIVMKEDRIAEVEEELRYQKQVHEAYIERHNKSLLRTEGVQEEINKVNVAPSKRLFKKNASKKKA